MANKKFPYSNLPQPPHPRICGACATAKGDEHFDEGKKHCRECIDKIAKKKANEEVSELAADFLQATASSSLDGFMEAVFTHLGGENQFAFMVAEQIKTGFDKYPGRASNLTAALNFMRLMGMRDHNKLNRELKDLSYEDMALAKAKLAKEVFMETMTTDERISFAKQLLASTGEMVIPEAIEGTAISHGD